MAQSCFDNDCSSISSCSSINRIVSYLKEYETTDIKNMGTAFNKSNHPFLTDDFNHVLLDHLGDTYCVEKSRDEFESIHNYIIERVKKHCELEKCAGYQRNNRNREIQNISLQEDEIENELSINEKEEYYIETLDTMHCFFIHTFDVGFRIKSNELNDIIDTNVDLTMNKLSSLLETKRERLHIIRGMERSNKTKFITNIDSQNVGYQTDDKKQTDGGDKDIKIDDDDEKNQEENDKMKRKEAKNKSYSFGFRYNYWNENNKNFVKPKYKNMKYELVNNNTFCIDIKKYKSIKQKAKQKLNSRYGKSLKSVGYAEKEYHIKAASPISCQQIMAVLFYTDFDTLSYHFSSTFRALNKTETKNINCCKLRNAEYCNLSRLLCETVNGFGTKIGDLKHVKKYYHGISGLLLFSSFLATFNSPTSTTLQVEVATIFAKNKGAILELGKHSKWLSYFNCSWLSAYSNEDERLFILPFESYYQLKFDSIISIATGQNYTHYIHALTALNYAVNGDKPKSKDIIDNKTDIKIIHKLMINESNKFPQYIQDIFTAFSKKKKKIGFKIKYINKYYPKMLSLFFDDKHLIKLVQICTGFPFCKSIVIDYNCGDYKNPKFFELTSFYFSGLLVALDLLNKNKKNTVLKTIKLDYVYPQNNHIFDKYKRKFLKQNWYIKEQSDHRYSLQTIIIKKINDDEKDEKIDKEFGNKNKNENTKNTSCQKIELKVKDFNGCFNRQRHPDNLLEEGENVFYSSKQHETDNDWIIFEIVNSLYDIKKIKIKNYYNEKFLKNSGIKKISLWIGNEQSIENNKWHELSEHISGIEEKKNDQFFIINSKIKTQQIKNEKLNLLKLVIEKNHGHKWYNVFYEFATFGLVLL